VPLPFYLRFVDAPDLAAAAARHLGLTTYDVKVLGHDLYEVNNGDKTHGVYRVLRRDGGRRILLSSGSHRSSILRHRRRQRAHASSISPTIPAGPRSAWPST
jgi:hypothetical protein